MLTAYADKLKFPTASILVRLDGLYGDAAPLLDVLSAHLGVIARSRAYHLLDLEVVQQALACTPSHVSSHPESGMMRDLYDCASVPLTPTGPQVRLVIATHPATSSPQKIGIERDGSVYELFISTLPSLAFTASDVLDLYLHRGSFETVLADEDDEQDADRWLCWLLVASVGQNRPVRTPRAISCCLPIPQRKSTILSMYQLIFTKG